MQGVRSRIASVKRRLLVWYVESFPLIYVHNLEFGCFGLSLKFQNLLFLRCLFCGKLAYTDHIHCLHS